MSEAAVLVRAAAGARAAIGILQRGALVQPAIRRPRPRIEAEILGRLGGLEVRLARTPAEIRAAQALRFKIFYEEMSARPNLLQQLTRLDVDRFDRHCDHLLVIDPARSPRFKDQVVGTYRLMRQEKASECGGFYGEDEFDIPGLVARHPGRRFLQLGRSCVLADYRGRRTVELLWHGIWAYVLNHRIDAMFGCASLPGTCPQELSAPLAFLRDNASAPDEWRVAASPGRAMVPTARAREDRRRALSVLPPLLKGYLRVGGYVSPDAVADHEFGTTDVFVVLPVERIAPRYVAHYGEAAQRFA